MFSAGGGGGRRRRGEEARNQGDNSRPVLLVLTIRWTWIVPLKRFAREVCNKSGEQPFWENALLFNQHAHRATARRHISPNTCWGTGSCFAVPLAFFTVLYSTKRMFMSGLICLHGRVGGQTTAPRVAQPDPLGCHQGGNERATFLMEVPVAVPDGVLVCVGR